MFVSLFVVGSVAGQTVSPTTTPAVKSASSAAVIVDKEIQNFKDKIATKVAELRKKNLKAIAGTITSTAVSSFTIKSNDEIEYTIKVDDTLTKMYVITVGSKKEIKFSDLKKGMYVIASGPLSDKTVSANVIYEDEQYLVKTGKVTEVNTDNNYVKVLTSDKDTYKLDIEVSSKLQILDSKTSEVGTMRFSKIKEGDTIHFTVKKTGTEKEVNRYPALKILIIPQEYFIK